MCFCFCIQFEIIYKRKNKHIVPETTLDAVILSLKTEDRDDIKIAGIIKQYK
jgi:hypothetical protein